MIFSEIEGILGALILGSTLVVQTRLYIRPMINTVVTQSVILAITAAIIGITTSDLDLIILAALIVVIRGVLVRHFLSLRLPKTRMFVKETSHGVSSVTMYSVVVLILSFLIYRYTFFPIIQSPLGAIGFSMIVQGLLLIITRRNSFAHFIGYVEEENGIIFMSLTIVTLPFLIEISVLLDVLALIIVGTGLVTENVEHMREEELMG
ncbi:MAG: hypothetical protein M1151_02810 [Candidatus Thermoplasmatota archaeon]|nr:hypothetical protein [Candidatus Thermoplasmatota archaeon]MCL5785585.1 hypothetical protein [Candidatus Thermoplasmatota archaeon]